MVGWILTAFLAAFGLICAVWTLCGLCLKPDTGRLLYQGSEPVEFARRYLWLREMGLIRCQLTVADPPESWLHWLQNREIDVIMSENRIQMGERRIESGAGDSSGRNQRRSISEL